MRDLAKQTFSSGQSSKIQISRGQMRIILVLVVVLLLLLGAKMLFYSSSPIGGGGIVLKDAPGGLSGVNIGAASDVQGGINLSKQSASLSSVDKDIPGSGTATRTYGDGSFNLTVSADLPDPKGNAYAAFAVGPDGPVFLDFLTGSGNSWSLNFNDKDKYSKYNEIWITKKITKSSKTPETKVLVGSF